MLTYIKVLLDEEMSWIGRCSKNGNKDYWRAVSYGVYSTISRLLMKLDDSEFPKIERLENSQEGNDVIGTYTLYGESYKISLDDYGQCYFITVGDEDYSLGTYNTDVERDCCGLILNHLYSKWLKELELIEK